MTDDLLITVFENYSKKTTLLLLGAQMRGNFERLCFH